MTDAPTTDAPVIVDNVEQARHLIAELSAPDAADTLEDGSLIAETVAALEALIDELELAHADTHAGRLADIVTKWADPEPGMLSKLPKPYCPATSVEWIGFEIVGLSSPSRNARTVRSAVCCIGASHAIW